MTVCFILSLEYSPRAFIFLDEDKEGPAVNCREKPEETSGEREGGMLATEQKHLSRGEYPHCRFPQWRPR